MHGIEVRLPAVRSTVIQKIGIDGDSHLGSSRKVTCLSAATRQTPTGTLEGQVGSTNRRKSEGRSVGLCNIVKVPTAAEIGSGSLASRNIVQVRASRQWKGGGFPSGATVPTPEAGNARIHQAAMYFSRRLGCTSAVGTGLLDYCSWLTNDVTKGTMVMDKQPDE